MPAWACPCPAKPQASWCAVAPALTRLSGVAPDWLGLVAPRDRADADELVAYAGAFGLCVEARGTDRPPTVQHDRAPGVLGLDLETDDIATPAFLTNGRDHRLGVERRRRAPQPHPPACLNAASTPAGPSNAFHTRAASRRRGGRSRCFGPARARSRRPHQRRKPAGPLKNAVGPGVWSHSPSRWSSLRSSRDATHVCTYAHNA